MVLALILLLVLRMLGTVYRLSNIVFGERRIYILSFQIKTSFLLIVIIFTGSELFFFRRNIAKNYSESVKKIIVLLKYKSNSSETLCLINAH